MRYLIAGAVLLVALGAAAFAPTWNEPGNSPGVRIVLAPSTTPAAPAPTDSIKPERVAATDRGGPVGFTMHGGRLYVVTARTDAAAKAASTAADKGTNLSFVCTMTTEKGQAFQAWPLRNAGSGGFLPDLSRDGEFLIAPHGGEALSCSLSGDDQ